MDQKIKRNPWSDQEVDILQRMHAAQKTIDEIRRVLKSRTESMIRNKAYDIGIRILVVPNPEIDMAEFKRLMGGKG